MCRWEPPEIALHNLGGGEAEQYVGVPAELAGSCSRAAASAERGKLLITQYSVRVCQNSSRSCPAAICMARLLASRSAWAPGLWVDKSSGAGAVVAKASPE